MSKYREPLIIPNAPAGFRPDIMQVAGALLKSYGVTVQALLDGAMASEALDNSQRVYLAELGASCRAILILNQLPPAGYKVDATPWEDYDRR